ncbi:MAG: ribosome biogenesis GTPase YlqF [Nitrosomonadales bacterium]
MTKAKKDFEKNLKFNDMVIEVIDARIPEASKNPMLNQIIKQRQKPHLKVLNKSDIADPKVTEQWLSFFNAEKNTSALAISSKSKKDKNKIKEAALKLVPHRGTSIKPLRAMIIGVPNVGKSTLINMLSERKIAKTGDVPAVTQMQQRILVADDFIITDTPGMMWPKIEDEVQGYYLAASNTIGINAYDEIETALFLLDNLKENYKQALQDRYQLENIECEKKSEILLEVIALNKKLLSKGNQVDLLKAAITLIQDYRHQKLGNISLEKPNKS